MNELMKIKRSNWITGECVYVCIYIYNLYVCVWIYKGKRIRGKEGREEGKKEGRGNWWVMAVRDQIYLPSERSSSNRQWVNNQNTHHVRTNSRMIDPVYIVLFAFEDADFQRCRCFSRGKPHKQSKTRSTGRSPFTNSHGSCSYRLSFLSLSHGP